MENPKHRLIEAAVRPLADNAEMHLAAVQFLGDIVSDDVGDVERLIERWNAADRKKQRSFWSVLWFLMLVLFIWVGVADYREISRYVAWRESIGGSTGVLPVPPDAALFTQLSDRQKLLFRGDGDSLDQSEALWRSEPENPAFFSEYACLFISKTKALPSDFFNIVRRIDPDNSWFTYLAASVEARNCVEQSVNSAGIEEWKILDQVRLSQATEMIQQASSRSRFESYSAEMMRERLTGYSPKNRIEQMDIVSMLSRYSSPFFKIHPVCGVLHFHVWSAAQNGDLEAFLKGSSEADHFLRGIVNDRPGTMLESVVVGGMVKILANQLSVSAIKLGHEEESAKWTRMIEKITADRKLSKSRAFSLEDRNGAPGMMAGTMFGYWLHIGILVPRHPPKLKDHDLEPGRLLDHEILSRASCYITWVIIGGFLVAVVAYQFRASHLGWRLAGRLEMLLDRRDWVWVIGAGILFPLAYVLGVNRLTPLGGRQFGMLGNALLLPTGHFLGLIFLWLTVPTFVIRWRLAKRAQVFGCTPTGWMGWLAVLSAVAFIPMLGWAVISQSYPIFWTDWMGELNLELQGNPSDPWRFQLALGLLIAPTLWLVVGVLRALLSRPNHVLEQLTAARILSKALLVAMILLGLATFGLKVSERHWFQKDNINKADPTKPGWTSLEHDIAAQMYKELRETILNTPQADTLPAP